MLAAIPGMYYAKKYADQEYERKVERVSLLMDRLVDPKKHFSDMYNRGLILTDVLKVIANEPSNSELTLKYTANPNITVKGINNLIEPYDHIEQSDLIPIR